MDAYNVFAGHIIESIETGVKNIEDTHVTVRETSNGVIVDGLQAGLLYVLYSTNGCVVAKGVTTMASLNLTLQKGLYVLKIEKVGTFKCMK